MSANKIFSTRHDEIVIGELIYIVIWHDASENIVSVAFCKMEGMTLHRNYNFRAFRS